MLMFTLPGVKISDQYFAHKKAYCEMLWMRFKVILMPQGEEDFPNRCGRKGEKLWSYW